MPFVSQIDLMLNTLAVTSAHDRPTGGVAGCGQDHLPREVTHLDVIAIGLVGLEHREFGIMGSVGTLVAEVPTNLENSSRPADHKPLEVQLWGNAQIKVQVVGVDVGVEWTRIRPAVDRLQNRRLNLDVVVT